MNHTPDTATAGNGGSFDPRQAAALLDQTSLQARRQLEPAPPWLLATRGVLALAACGAVWLSVRGQHPYHYPNAAVIPAAVATFVIINFAATLAVRRRATAGVTGKSPLRPAENAILAAAWIGPFIALGAMAGAGVSDAVVYGIFPATVPLMTAGLAWAGIMAARANWRSCGVGLAVAAVGVVGLFAGPAGAWLVMGIGLCAVLLGAAAATAWRQRRGPARP